MLIEYNVENIVEETPPIYNPKTSIPNIDTSNLDTFVPTYEINDVAYFTVQDKLGWNIAHVYGDINNFIANNNINDYNVINEIPVEGIDFFIDISKAPRPSNYNDILKYQARTEIDTEVGDIYDLLTDLSRRVTMMERLSLRMAKDLIDFDEAVTELSSPLVPTIKAAYKPLIDNYFTLLTVYNNEVDIADLEDPTELFDRLFKNNKKMHDIKKKKYIDLKI